ncbi:MAG TPA: hypothetical protein DD735_11035 [Clostridiales bacterium]|nr:hypothetical protein [Clostridiales bacterium]
MALRECDYCGKAFCSLGPPICPECTEILDRAYAKARKYIYQGSGPTNFTDIVNNAGVSEKALSFLIDQGRIVLGGRAWGNGKCRVCGREAKDGVLCGGCREKLSAEKLIFQAVKAEGTLERSAKTGVLPLIKK